MKLLQMTLLLSVFLFLNSTSLMAAGPEEKLARKSGCFKCHSIKKEKKGPSYQSIAIKYTSEPESAETLFTHLTSEPMVEVKGKEQKHKKLKTDDPEKIKAVIEWIFTLK